jgi:dienelactone hydrolase
VRRGIKMEINYSIHQQRYCGQIFYPNIKKEHTPLIIIFHDWAGCHEGIISEAEKWAKLGYISFAVDLFGDGKQGKGDEECMKLIQPHFDEPEKYRSVLTETLVFAKTIEGVDPNNVAIIGFCFGGYSLLELARENNDFKLGFCVHGLLNTEQKMTTKPSAKLHILHGFLDPMATYQNVKDLIEEFETVNADWELLYFSNSSHAFTNVNANDDDGSKKYDQNASNASFAHIHHAIENFLNTT